MGIPHLAFHGHSFSSVLLQIMDHDSPPLSCPPSVSHLHLSPSPLSQPPCSLSFLWFTISLAVGANGETVQDQVPPLLKILHDFVSHRGCLWYALTASLWPPLLLLSLTHSHPSCWPGPFAMYPRAYAHTLFPLSRMLFPSYLQVSLSYLLRSFLTCCLLTEAFPSSALQKRTPSHPPCCPNLIFFSSTAFLIDCAFFLLILFTVCLSSVNVAHKGQVFV